MGYDVPGRAEQASDELVGFWNEEIERAHEALGEIHSRFFAHDPATLGQPQMNVGVTWPADPLEPTYCTSSGTVRELCDWGNRGRQLLHNEYCEYAIVRRVDTRGRERPKRVQVTTELREYWLTLAMHDPEQLLAAASNAIGEEPQWSELYGVDDPWALDKDERRQRFAVTVAGHGNNRQLEETGVPRDPIGRLNTDNALFMSNPINGLDDLIFVALFGARRFAVRGGDGKLRRAERHDIFVGPNRRIACRHADPAVALAAYRTVLADRTVGFANPLGVYIRPFNHGMLEVAGEAIPDSWVRWSRGEAGMFQRLELGPGDDDEAFLDDIELTVGQERQRLRGGHQLLRMLEVGPLLATGPTSPAREDEYEEVPAGHPIECHRGGLCDEVAMLERDYTLSVRTESEPGLPASI
jgi:hypothetical protein